MPVAVNGSVEPQAMLGFAGVTAIDTRVAEVTVSVVLPEMLPSVAETVVLPAATALASPSEPLALLRVATLLALEDQVTCVVRFCVELSENTPGSELLGGSAGDAQCRRRNRD